jgi:hypothetical protein
LPEDSPPVTKRASEQISRPPSPLEAVKTTAPLETSHQSLNQPMVISDSAVDLNHTQAPTLHESLSGEPPESTHDQDWDTVFEKLARLRRETMQQMNQEARRRALLRTVSEPSNIRQLIDFQLTTSREEHYPPSELGIGAEGLESLKSEFGPHVLSELDSL